MQNKSNLWMWAVALFIGAWIVYSYRNPQVSGEKPLEIAASEDPWFQSEVAKQELPVLVKFGAEWCGPCRAMEPVLVEISKSMDSQVKVVDVDIDKNESLAKHYQVGPIPRMFLFDHGKIIANRTGSTTRDDLEKWIASNLKR